MKNQELAPVFVLDTTDYGYSAEEVFVTPKAPTGIEHHGGNIINHDTKEYIFNDGRKAEDCAFCHKEKSYALEKKLRELEEQHWEVMGYDYPHHQRDVMESLCPKHLYEYIY